MNIKYNYLYEYIINGDKNDEPFNIDKFNLYADNVDFLYFFVCNAKKYDYNDYDTQNLNINKKKSSKKNKEKEEEQEKYFADELKYEYFEEIPNKYYIKINRIIPVIAIIDNEIIFRNIDAFYIKGFIKVPVDYFKSNPAINNYSKLVRNISKGDFEYISITKFLNEQKLDTYQYKNNNDYTFNNNILFNKWAGLSNKINDDNYNVEWVKLNVKEITDNVLMYTPQPYENTYDKQIKNMGFLLKYSVIINSKNDKNQYTNNIAKIAHKYYMPYCYDFNNMNEYNWINFINNQYDYGVFITEDNYLNFIENWNYLREKYFSIFGYPKIKIQKNIIIKYLQNDPNWNNIIDKKAYLNNCIKIGNKYYTKNYYYVCCEHEYKRLHGEYYANMIIRENNQEICKYCGELIGDYNDERVFSETMNELTNDITINYKWTDKISEKKAKYAWNDLVPYINCIDSNFLMNNSNVNKFIQLYNNEYKRYVKDYKIENLSETIIKIFREEFKNTKNIEQLVNNIVSRFIDEKYKNYQLTDSENNKIIKNKLYNICYKYIKIYFYNSRQKNIALDPKKIFNFMNLIQKRTNNFIKFIVICYVIGIIYGNQESNYEFNYSNLDFSVIIGNTISEVQDKTTIIFPINDMLDLSIYNINDNDNITKNHLIEYINKFFDKLGGGVKIILSPDSIDINSISVKKIHDQEQILKQYKISDFPYVYDSFTCPNILTRNFNSNAKSLQELAHAYYPNKEQYIQDKYENNIAKYFNPLKRIEQFNYISLIKEINSYIRNYEELIYGAITEDISLIIPSLEKFNNQMKLIEKLSIFTKNITNIENTCNDNKRIKYNKMIDFILIGIDDVNKKFELFLNENEKIDDIQYEHVYKSIKKVKKSDIAIDIRKKITRVIILCYLLCTYIESVNEYNILNICIDNFYMHIIEQGMKYKFIKNYNTTDVDSLIDKFITEFFDYNDIPNSELKFFFNELKKHTQLFITPDYYLDGNTKIKRINQKVETNEELQREIELKEMDIEENGIQQFIDYDKVDFINFGMDVVEELDQNELIGGEVENDYIIDEDIY